MRCETTPDSDVLGQNQWVWGEIQPKPIFFYLQISRCPASFSPEPNAGTVAIRHQVPKPMSSNHPNPFSRRFNCKKHDSLDLFHADFQGNRHHFSCIFPGFKPIEALPEYRPACCQTTIPRRMALASGMKPMDSWSDSQNGQTLKWVQWYP